MNTKTEHCPVCGTGTLNEIADQSYEFKHGRKTHIVGGLLHSVCGECGTSMFLPEQMRANNLRVREFQNHLEDYISPAQVLELRERYELTQTQANQIFGGGPTAFSKYERGISNPSAGAARQMLAALRDPSYMSALLLSRGLTINQSNDSEFVKANLVDLFSAELYQLVEQYAGAFNLAVKDACEVLIRSGLKSSSIVVSRVTSQKGQRRFRSNSFGYKVKRFELDSQPSKKTVAWHVNGTQKFKEECVE